MYTEIPLSYSLENRKDTPVPKPSKPLTELYNYRPISLLSIPSKIFENIIYSYLLKHLNKHDTIVPQQFGFRQNIPASSNSRGSEYNTIIEMNENRITQLILLDLEKVFDSLWHEALLYKLKIHAHHHH